MGVRLDSSGEALKLLTEPVNPFTVCGWAKLSVDKNTFACLWAWESGDPGSDTAAQLMLTTDNTGTLFGLYDTTAFNSMVTLTVGTWFRWAVSVNTGPANCIAYASNTPTGALTVFNAGAINPSGLDRFLFGANSFSAEFWDGVISNVKIFDSVLTEAQIENALATNAPSSLNPWAWYPMVDATTATCAKDFTGNVRDLTELGTLAVEDGAPVPWGGTTVILTPPGAAADPGFSPGGGLVIGSFNSFVGEGMVGADDAAASVSTNTEFTFPTYPGLGSTRMTGPAVLRQAAHTQLPLDQAPPTNTEFIFPTYPAASHQRMSGPAILRVGVQFPPLPLDQAPLTNTEFVFPVYPATANNRVAGPAVLRGGWRHYPLIAWLEPANEITILLTGVSATGSQGTLGVDSSVGLTGQQGTGQLGETSGGQPLVGVQATGAVGVVVPLFEITPAGVQATGQFGTLVVDSSVGLVGNQATGAFGTLGVVSAPSLLGNQASGLVGVVLPASSVQPAGVASTGVVGGPTSAETIPLGGVQGTGEIGVVSPPGGATLVGLAGTGQTGTMGVTQEILLVGVQATGQVGVVGATNALLLTGHAGTGAIGAPSAAMSLALSGLFATPGIGDLGILHVAPLAGAGALGSIGQLAVEGGPTVGTVRLMMWW